MPTKTSKILDRQFFRGGELLIREGDYGNRAYFIERGRVEVYREDKDGRKLTIAELGPGSIIGEMAVITQDRRTASIRTLDDCVLVSISQDLQRALSKTDKVFKALIEIMIERVNNANNLLFKQYMDLSELEEAAELTVQNTAYIIAEDQQEQFRKEVAPILEHLRDTLHKYRRIDEDKLH